MGHDTQAADDVVVVGGGIAGLSCALRAAELGLRVRVVEQGREEDYSCNSRMTGGAFHLAMGAVGRDPEEVVRLLARANAGNADLVRDEHPLDRREP